MKSNHEKLFLVGAILTRNNSIYPSNCHNDYHNISNSYLLFFTSNTKLTASSIDQISRHYQHEISKATYSKLFVLALADRRSFGGCGLRVDTTPYYPEPSSLPYTHFDNLNSMAVGNSLIPFSHQLPSFIPAPIILNTAIGDFDGQRQSRRRHRKRHCCSQSAISNFAQTSAEYSARTGCIDYVSNFLLVSFVLLYSLAVSIARN